MILKEMKYNLHYGNVRGDVLPPPRGTNTSYSVVKPSKYLLSIFNNPSKYLDVKLKAMTSICFSSERDTVKSHS